MKRATDGIRAPTAALDTHLIGAGEMPTPDHTTSVDIREIPDLPHYGISSDGRTWTQKRRCGTKVCISDQWRELKPTPQYVGHMLQTFNVGGRKVYRLVHRLVLEVFFGPCPEGMECRHLDGNPGNNRLDNLAWGTKKENQADSRRHGTAYMLPGRKGEYRKIDERSAIEIRKLASEGVSRKALSIRFGLGTSQVGRIVRRDHWKHA